MRTEPSVFIVHNPLDREDFQAALYHLEDTLGIVPSHVDPGSLAAQDVLAIAKRGIEKCRLVLLLISNHFGSDDIDRIQYDYARQMARLIIPFTVGHALSTGWQLFEFATQDGIDLLNCEQNDKFIRNVRLWLGTNSQGAGNREGLTAVDMGLGVKWANCNLGSRFEDLPGSYFAWGELNARQWYGQKRQDYIWELKPVGKPTFTEEDGESVTSFKDWSYTKYTSGELDTLEAVDDAASFLLKGTWHIPSREDFQQLLDNCSIQWMEAPPGIPDGKSETYIRSGFLFTSRINGNSLFFPLTGHQENDREECSLIQTHNFGGYWTASLKNNSAYALFLFPQKAALRLVSDKGVGLNIRPVCI